MGRKRKAPEPPSSSSSDSNGFNWVQDHVAAASLAYKEENESDMDDKIKLSEGWQIHKTIEGKSGVKLKIWVSPKNGNVMIGFRGTSSMKEMRLDASLGSTAFQNVRGENVGYVYKGFAQGWEDIKPALEREMNVLRATSYVPDGATLQFAGHSLGGALAEIASTYFADVYPNVKVAETSIGAPTSGDKHFGEYSRSRLNLQRMRIVAAGDPVANVKLPGMEYVENTNVLNFSHTKKSKTSWETFKKVVGSVMPSIAIGNQLYDSYKNHSLGSYEETLLQDFQDESILTLRDDPETLAVEAENQYQASKEGDMPMEDDGSCLCECHIYDKALTEGKIAPVSLGTIPKTNKPTNKSAMATTNDPMAEKVTNSEGDQIMQSALQLEIQQSEEDQKIMAEADVSDIMDMINEGLEKQKSKAEKSREDTANQVAKLQEQYANLTNQHEAENFDTVSLERNRFTQASDDLGYFQMRIDMELENPAYVPNDSDGSTTSRDKAIKFKNRMNKVYSLIMSVKSKQYAATLDPDYKEISDKEKRETLVADQVAQTAQATKDGDLNPDEQQNEYVFDIDTLTDMDGPEPQTNSLKIIQKWLEYTNMSPIELYNTVRETVVSQYKQDRVTDLRRKEQETRVSSAANIKNQIDSLSNQNESTQTSFQTAQKARENLFTKLSSSRDFVRMIREKKVDINKLMDKVQTEDDAPDLMKAVFGYNPSTAFSELQNSYEKKLLEQSRGLGPDAYNQMLTETQSMIHANQNYPWLDPESFKGLRDKFKDNPEELERQANSLRPTTPAEFMITEDRSMMDVGKDPKLLSKMVEGMPDGGKNIKGVEFHDYYRDEKKKLEVLYNDPEKLKEMFNKWNGGDSTNKTKNFFGALANTFSSTFGGGVGGTKFVNDANTLLHGGEPQYGWFNKDGDFMGVSASPDFADYARAHPELGFKYVQPIKNSFTEAMDVVESTVGGIVEGVAGINPMDIKSKANELAGFSEPDYNQLNGEIRTQADRDAEDSGDYRSGSNNEGDGGFGTNDYAMMSMMNNRNNNNSNNGGAGSSRPIAGETAPLEKGAGRQNFGENVPLSTKFNSRTSNISIT